MSLRKRPSPKTLDKLYVPLRARSQNGKDKHEKDNPKPKQPEIIDIIDAIENHQHLFIVGKPGARKFTLLREIALRCWEKPESIGLDKHYIPLIVFFMTSG